MGHGSSDQNCPNFTRPSAEFLEWPLPASSPEQGINNQPTTQAQHDTTHLACILFGEALGSSVLLGTGSGGGCFGAASWAAGRHVGALGNAATCSKIGLCADATGLGAAGTGICVRVCVTAGTMGCSAGFWAGAWVGSAVAPGTFG